MQWRPRPAERRPDPAPLPTDDRLAVLVGLAAWVVAGVVVLVERHRLDAAGRGWWLQVVAAGLGLGLLGLVHLHRRDVRSRR